MNPKEGYFMLSSEVHLVVSPTHRGGVLTITRGGNGMRLNLKEWLDLYRHHDKINDKVHAQWREPADKHPVEGPDLIWTGLPKKVFDTAEPPEGADAIDVLTSDWITRQFIPEFKRVLDEKVGALTLGEDKRVRVRFTGQSTQFHFYTYNERAAIETMMLLTFDEWSELYKQMDVIKRMAENRLYVEEE
jgi:hypothetical protein